VVAETVPQSDAALYCDRPELPWVLCLLDFLPDFLLDFLAFFCGWVSCPDAPVSLLL